MAAKNGFIFMRKGLMEAQNTNVTFSVKNMKIPDRVCFTSIIMMNVF